MPNHAEDPGRIERINASEGGVPKREIDGAWVAEGGLDADRQAHAHIHGGPLRALCLYSAERIEALRREGHPIEPGMVGENLTLRGVPWERMQPNTTWALGSDVVIRITSFTSPCRSIAAAFHDDDFMRISEDRHPGWSRVYAQVLHAGRIEPGDPVHRVADAPSEAPSSDPGE